MQNDKNPFMPFVEDFEAEAETFLRKYCKEVLDSPQATPIRDIAQKQMNLDIVDTESLSPDDSIQGAIAFSAGIIEVYDWSSEEYIGYKVSQPTVFLDADIINPGRANNTLAHECYHWYKHRAYFRYQSTHSLGAEFAFRCLTAGQRGHNEQWSDIEKMEWQARTIAPKILMPRCTVRMLLSERLGASRSGNFQMSALKAVVEEIAEIYNVSRQSAAIRVSELGYPEAVELYNNETIVIDRRHRRSSTAAKFHQQPIDEVTAFQLYMSNELLKSTLDTGAFCYAEGYFVLRDEKYVLPGEDALFLTEYARLHLSECTLDFSYKLVCSRTNIHDAQYMFRADTEYKKLPSYDSNTQNMDEYYFREKS
jgi:Zn-dependent peptidase ImmA (M78 family)